MSEMPQKLTSPIRETTPEAIRLAKTLIRTANFASLAVLDPNDGRPHVSRISVAPDHDGTPLTLISTLSYHTKALLADRRCGLLVGEPAKGDPLAHPRISLACNASFVDRSDPQANLISPRYLRFNPKSGLYAGFADFCYVRLTLVSANLNGGFGKAYVLDGDQLRSPVSGLLRESESKLIEDLNRPGNPWLPRLAEKMRKGPFGKISVVAVDSEGINIVTGGKPCRFWFAERAQNPEKVLEMIVSE